MLDIKLFRENPNLIVDSEKKRFKDPSKVYKVIEFDEKWRATKQQREQLSQQRNQINKK